MLEEFGYRAPATFPTVFPPAAQLNYLRTLAEMGSVGAAARAAGCCLVTIRDFRDRNDGFLDAEEVAWELFRGRIHNAAVTRAVDGVNVEVFGKDGLLGTKKVYSDFLLEKLLKAHIPSFGEKIEHRVSGGTLVVPGSSASPEDWEEGK